MSFVSQFSRQMCLLFVNLLTEDPLATICKVLIYSKTMTIQSYTFRDQNNCLVIKLYKILVQIQTLISISNSNTYKQIIINLSNLSTFSSLHNTQQFT